MIILDISPFKGSMMCVELTGGALRENMKIYVRGDILSRSGFVRGMEISEEQADRLIYENDLHRARERALYLMESRDHSYSELFDKLQKNYSEEICFKVCDSLAGAGVINDRRYAERLCRRLFETKGLGHYRVRQEMRMKGLPDEIIVEVMEEFEDGDDTLSRLEELVERSFERYLTDRKGVNKVKNALARRGYSYEDINAVLELYDLDFDE